MVPAINAEIDSNSWSHPASINTANICNKLLKLPVSFPRSIFTLALLFEAFKFLSEKQKQQSFTGASEVPSKPNKFSEIVPCS